MNKPIRVSRCGDYTTDTLAVSRTPDGDYRVTIGHTATVAFCQRDNGGNSPATIAALEKLFEAMASDNNERPDKRNPDP